MKTSIKVIAMIAIVALATITANAQFNIGGPGTNGSGTNANGTQNGGPTPTVPFDGGMSLMLAALGIAYASKKIRGMVAIKAI